MPVIPQRLTARMGADAIGMHRSASGSTTSIALSTAYVHRTSGNVVAIRHIARSAQPINELMMFQTAVAGTGGAIVCDIYGEGPSTTQPDDTPILDSSTATSSTAVANRWVKFTFGTPYTPAVGEILWFVLRNTDAAPGTNNASFHSALSAGVPDPAMGNIASQGYSSTVGFSAAGTQSNRTPFMIKEGSLWYGNPFNMAGTAPGSSTLMKGMRFTPRETAKIMAVDMTSGVNNIDKFRIYGPGQLPNDTPLFEWDMDSDAGQTTADLMGMKFFAPANQPILQAGVQYSAIFTYVTNGTGITFVTIGDYVGGTYEADIDALRLSDPHACPIYLRDDGANAWVEDKTLMPSIRLLYAERYNEPSFSGFIGG